MNFLAHSFLSGSSETILVGNFIGDFVKGQGYRDYEGGIQKGIILHREIDSFTDQHQLVRQSKVRLQENYHHYAGVVVDLFYDHFLARNWARYSNQSLAEFAQQVYRIIAENQEDLPKRVSIMLNYMVRGNWLLNYAEINGIDRALTGMASRTKFRSNMENATQDLEKHYQEFESEFLEFFPQIMDHVKVWIDENQ